MALAAMRSMSEGASSFSQRPSFPRADMSTWMKGGETVSYQRLDLNNKSQINVLSNISLAQLQAFGSFVANRTWAWVLPST